MRFFDERRRVAALVLALLGLAAAAAEAAGYRKPKNPRRRKDRAAPVQRAPEAAVDRSSAAVENFEAGARGLPEGLRLRRWTPQAKELIEEVALTQGRRSPGYDPEKKPLAVLPWDRTVFDGDVAEAVFRRLVSRAEFKFSEDFWRLIPLGYGRQRIRAAYEHFSSMPSSIWEAQAPYQQYRKAFLRSYLEICKNIGRRECRLYLARLLLGFDPAEAVSYARATIGDELGAEAREELVRDSTKDPFPVRLRVGMRPVPEFEDLVSLLQREGFEILVVDLDAQQLLEAALAEYGLDPTRAAGIRQQVKRDRLSGIVEDPVPHRGGKVEAVARTGRQPALVIGGSADDADLLAYGDGARILLDAGLRPEVRAQAKRSGWLLQPAFIR